MSEDDDKESKTEEPSEKRVRDAVEKGNVPHSAEPGILSSLLAILTVCSLIAAHSSGALTQDLALLLENAGTLKISDGSDAFQTILDTVWRTFAIAAPILGIISAGGVVGILGQNIPQANLERIIPKFARISPSANLKKLLGKQALVNFAKMSLKVLAVVAVAFWALKREFSKIVDTSMAEVTSIPNLILNLFTAIVAPLCILALLIAIVDMVFTRMNWVKDLRMTRQELKDEHKQSEGDPAFKEKIRSAARQRIRSRMMAELPRATVVIANPTHYAVALRYVPQEGGAPLVIAKGIDHLALRIRKSCEEFGIPVVENKALARSLHAETEVGEMIPAEFYRAVAEVIHFVEKRDRAFASRRTQV